ncbi:MAG: endopeptidase La [Deltaproteobacteria bacterium GWC2_42_11]|nr:MAG: endopeptidase La [Deltaproteobacteria bacterium GWC2_42_11]HBO84747.1 endopeptidase La [Deltaproteobacteria bacterium]
MFFKEDKDTGFQKGKEIIASLMPLRDIVVFPYMVVPLFVGREKSINALEFAMANGKNILLSAQKKAKTDDPAEEDIHSIGTLATILQLLRLPDGTVKVLVEGKRRAMIKEFIPSKECFMVKAEEMFEPGGNTSETEAIARNCLRAFETYVKLNKNIPPEMIMSVSSIDDLGRLADTIASHLQVKITDRQSILEVWEPTQRLEKLYTLLEGEIEILGIEQRVRNRVKKQMEKSQKEYYLGEQMKAIQKELGEKDEFKNELHELEERIKNKKMSKEAAKKVKHEFKKLKLMPPMSAEATVVRNYIDWILSLPWMEMTEDKKDIDAAEKVLEEDHYGLKNVKDRIIEYLAVHSLVEEIKGQILCFVGPPGVGKTSLAKSIARAMGRKFIRVSLGGVKDEAEIRGHRRTYIGSMPGKIIQSLKKAGSNNPVFLLDEVDKMSTDFRGDPASALLEVLDPEQNHTFNDHYLDLDYDLSKVMFITTANSLHGIPYPLLDRMEVIRIAGYTEYEKLNIAKKFLVPKQLKAHGLPEDNIRITDSAILTIIRRHTKEAGVRNLEREIASICRKLAKAIIKKGKDTNIEVSQKNIAKYLGVPKYRYGISEEKDEVGVTTGLAWTEAGGELLSTEVTVMPGKGKLIITGKLGDVMQESAQAAMSYIRSRGGVMGLAKDFYQNIDIHIHVPEGAIPKDGPSAGIAIATSIASALIKIPVKKDIAMTGEITLRGKILPIGGLKEKILAAHRGNMKTVLIPKENEKDIKEIPANIRKEIDIKLVGHMDEVLKLALATDKPEDILRKEPDKDNVYEKADVTQSIPDSQVITH